MKGSGNMRIKYKPKMVKQYTITEYMPLFWTQCNMCGDKIKGEKMWKIKFYKDKNYATLVV